MLPSTPSAHSKWAGVNLCKMPAISFIIRAPLQIAGNEFFPMTGPTVNIVTLCSPNKKYYVYTVVLTLKLIAHFHVVLAIAVIFHLSEGLPAMLFGTMNVSICLSIVDYSFLTWLYPIIDRQSCIQNLNKRGDLTNHIWIGSCPKIGSMLRQRWLGINP